MSHALNSHLAGRSIQGAPPEAWGALGDWLTDKISAGYNYPIGQNLPEAPRIPKLNIDPQSLLAASYGVPGLASTPGENTVETDAAQNIAEILGYDLFANKDSRTLGNIGLEAGGAVGDAAALSAKFGPAVLALLAGHLRKVDNFDPRFDPRIKEQQKLSNQQVETEGQRIEPDVINLEDYEGQNFITSMSDRTEAGDQLIAINNNPLREPQDRLGGQGYMFENPGQVWASGEQPANEIVRLAGSVKNQSKQGPLYIPWRMAPSGGDFSTSTGELMINYASSNMSKAVKKELDSAIRKFETVGSMVKGRRVNAGKKIKGWKGVDDPNSIKVWRETPDHVRKELMNMMDVKFRQRDGLSIGQSRLALADPDQLILPDAGIQNIGRIDTSKPIISASGHPSYPSAIPGEGIGRVADEISIFDLLPSVVKERKMNINKPNKRDIRALQMKPYSGTVTEDVLRNAEKRRNLVKGRM